MKIISYSQLAKNNECKSQCTIRPENKSAAMVTGVKKVRF